MIIFFYNIFVFDIQNIYISVSVWKRVFCDVHERARARARVHYIQSNIYHTRLSSPNRYEHFGDEIEEEEEETERHTHMHTLLHMFNVRIVQHVR